MLYETLESRRLFAATTLDEWIGFSGSHESTLTFQAAQTRSVVEVVRSNRVRYGIPGFIAATLRNGMVDEIGAAGVRLAGQPDRLRWGDPMLIASGTKAMTATLAARLVERGYIKWTHKIVDVFPGYIGRIRPQYEKVTLEQLLLHQGGLPLDLSTELTIATALATDDPMVIRGNYLRSMLRQAPVGPVGETSYSNVGYIIAGVMMEFAMREPFENLMRRLIFEPLGMSSAGFGWPGSSRVLDAPRPHDALGQPQRPDSIFRFPGVYNPSGGVHVNINDWARFAGMQLGQVSRRFLSLASLRKLHTPVNGVAMGWNVVSRSGAQLLQHDGTDGFWYSSILLDFDRKTGILVMGNRGGPSGERAVHETLAQLLDRLFT